jgi:DNA-binding NarL/FixJ family response regulator
MKESINIFLADDHQIVIDGLMLLLKNEANVIIVGTATDGDKALEEIQQLKPDIALIDLRMPGKDGLQIIRSLHHKISTRFIILSMHSDRRYITDAINYGADGYLLKNTGKEALLDTIYRVCKGEKCFPDVKTGNKDSKETFLTPRELDVLKLIINEYTSQEIAEKLSLSQYTVDTHRKSIYRKTGAKNLIGLVRYAIDRNISFNE